MKFIFPHTPASFDQDILSQINEAANSVSSILTDLSLGELKISDYNKRYLRKYARKSRQTLQKYAFILSMAADLCRKPLREITLVDYGGGSGLLSILAKKSGFGKVIYNDIFDLSITDTRILTSHFGAVPDFFVLGDIADVQSFLHAKGIACDSIVSCDVMEHIYDMPTFFSHASRLPGINSLVMSTHANPWNPAINRILKRQQKLVETTDRVNTAEHKQRDALKSYRSLRANIIREAFELSPLEVNYLAEATRGMHKADIVSTVESYLKTKSKPSLPDHPTNTCDPNNGNWADRLTSPIQYQKWLQSSGFDAGAKSGYYGHPKPLLRRLLAQCLDLCIRFAGIHGIRLAAYFIVYGKKAK